MVSLKMMNNKWIKFRADLLSRVLSLARTNFLANLTNSRKLIRAKFSFLEKSSKAVLIWQKYTHFWPNSRKFDLAKTSTASFAKVSPRET